MVLCPICSNNFSSEWNYRQTKLINLWLKEDDGLNDRLRDVLSYGPINGDGLKCFIEEDLYSRTAQIPEEMRQFVEQVIEEGIFYVDWEGLADIINKEFSEEL